MCLLFCFVLFWILCCVVCKKNENKKLLITKKKERLKLKDDAVLAILNPTVMPHQTSVSNCYYVVTTSLSVITDCLILGVARYMYSYRHGTGISVRCMRPYKEYRQFTPNPEGGARSNTTLFDNRQQKNSDCHELRA